MLADIEIGEEFLLQVLLQLIVIIVAARAGGWLFARCGQPQVVGEILTGLLLGPSCLGKFNSDFLDIMFPAQSSPVLYVFGQIGLIFLMFVIGLEFDFSWLRSTGRAAAGVAISGIVLPFGLGAGLAWAIHSQVAPEHNIVGFVLFTATALSITAIPILGRIMKEFQLTQTPLGVLTISAAAIDDALGWMLLAAVSAGVHGSFSFAPFITMVGMTFLFIAAVVFLVRPLAILWFQFTMRDQETEFSLFALSVVLLAVLLSAVATNLIGIFSIFGPFILGAVLSDQLRFQRVVRERIEEFVTAFFLPVFFTYTGLQTDVGLLNTPELWFICGLLILTAVVGKLVGCGLAARVGGMSWRDSIGVGVMMNTRALMGLVAINIGRDLGVIPDTVFSMMVLMAITTTIMTAPLLKCLLRFRSPRSFCG